MNCDVWIKPSFCCLCVHETFVVLYSQQQRRWIMFGKNVHIREEWSRGVFVPIHTHKRYLVTHTIKHWFWTTQGKENASRCTLYFILLKLLIDLFCALVCRTQRDDNSIRVSIEIDAASLFSSLYFHVCVYCVHLIPSSLAFNHPTAATLKAFLTYYTQYTTKMCVSQWKITN